MSRYKTVQDRITLHCLIISNYTEWENAGECIVEGNQALGRRNQTMSYKNYMDMRVVACYPTEFPGIKLNLSNYMELYVVSLSSSSDENHNINIRTEDIDQRRNQRAYL